MRRRGCRFRGDVGSATVWVLTLSALVCVCATAAVLVGQAAVARHRAEAAADLAALAAADAALWGGPAACAVASRVAVANDGVLDLCLVRDGIAEVTILVPLRGALSRLGPAGARARAGPGSLGPTEGAGSAPVGAG